MKIGEKYVKLDSIPISEVMFHIDGFPHSRIKRAHMDAGVLFVYIDPGSPGFMAEPLKEREGRG